MRIMTGADGGMGREKRSGNADVFLRERFVKT